MSSDWCYMHNGGNEGFEYLSVLCLQVWVDCLSDCVCVDQLMSVSSALHEFVRLWWELTEDESAYDRDR